MITFVVVWLLIAVGVLVALFFVTAPYGRHARQGWGATVPEHLGWLLMEAPAALIFASWFVLCRRWDDPVAWVFVAMWELHYVYRAFVYPFTLRSIGKSMPLSIVGMAVVFNSVNVSLNAWWVFSPHDGSGYGLAWLDDPRFVAGTLLFLGGLVVNRASDATLRRLRPPSGGGGYGIPQGGLYRWVSCPNYFGEIVQWTGWAIATWSLPGLTFAVWTAANLVPRAHANHEWYRQQFPGYPAERRALIPGLW